jgi:hypothetical protein
LVAIPKALAIAPCALDVLVVCIAFIWFLEADKANIDMFQMPKPCK